MDHPEIYSLEYYRRIFELEERHWWHIGMRAIAFALLRSRNGSGGYARVLDAGCGTGGMMIWARDILQAKCVVGVDVASTALGLCVSRSSNEMVSRASVLQLPFRSNLFDLLFCQDVLQHLPTDGSDVKALVEIRRVLRPGGFLLVRSNSRWGMRQRESTRDSDFQRYTLEEMISRLQSGGFVVKRATYANAVPALYASVKQWMRPEGERKQHAHRLYEGLNLRDTALRHPIVNRMLLWILQTEARFLSAPDRALRFGHTTVCVAMKPRDSDTLHDSQA